MVHPATGTPEHRLGSEGERSPRLYTPPRRGHDRDRGRGEDPNRFMAHFPQTHLDLRIVSIAGAMTEPTLTEQVSKLRSEILETPVQT